MLGQGDCEMYELGPDDEALAAPSDDHADNQVFLLETESMEQTLRIVRELENVAADVMCQPCKRRFWDKIPSGG